MLREKDLAAYLDPTARTFLTAPFSKEQLSEEEKQRSDQGWQDYVGGKAFTLKDAEQRRPHGPRR